MLQPSRERLGQEILDVLAALRARGQGRYACILDRTGLVFEHPEPETAGDWALHRFLSANPEAVFAIPRALAGDAPLPDAFEDWHDDEFLVAVINGKVGVVVACPDAEGLRQDAMEPLKVLADRLLRYEPGYRVDEKGRGLFFGRPRLDLVVVGRGEA